MATNTKLTKDIAEKLIKGEKVICPNCGKRNRILALRKKK